MALSRPLLIALAAAAVILAGCSSSKEEGPEYVERPVDAIYNDAVDAALGGDYHKAAPLFDEVERQHPYSVWATQAQLMAAYSLYQTNKYDDAVNALDRFIKLNPGHANVDYAYYLKALSYYERIVDVGRDQKITQQALDIFTELVKRFPDSKYSRDARLKLDLTRNHLAGKEMSIGRYYLRGGRTMAAINRFKSVIVKFDTTDQVPEALHRLTEAYLALGLTDEAKRTAAVLGHNYPGSEWYQDSYSLMLTGKTQDEATKAADPGVFGWGLWIF
ncbi:MAG: outer membrane protein assembly factor BamD [Rhodospirillaceae bacterium]|jgi:outer membrane protein assembly factor BamD|nr:outer membrane protein assembly factor BamD [Rhodospirillaceae bacterium]